MVRFDQLAPLFAAVAMTACADRPPAHLAAPESRFGSGAQSVAEAAPQEGCSVSVLFGSFATGPDKAAMLAVSRLLAGDPAATRVTRSAYGPEGEHRLCIQTPDRSSATRLFDSLKSAVREPVAAPVTIVGPDHSISAKTVNKR